MAKRTPIDPGSGQQVLELTLGPLAECWGRENGHLSIDGQPLSARVPQTPAYLYSRRCLDAAAAALRTALPESIGIHYAIKANPFPPLVRHMAGLVDGFDCASLAEMQLAGEVANAEHNISIAGPAKSRAEHRHAIEHGITINAESVGELERIMIESRAMSRRARVALRVNPPFALKGSGMHMGGGARPFGIDSEAIPALLEQRETLAEGGIDLVGLHLFAGSQSLDAEAIAGTLDAWIELLREWQTTTGYTPDELIIGPGLGVAYHPGDRPLDFDVLAPAFTRLGKALATLGDGGDTTIDTRLELGRFLVAGAGVYLTRVIDRKVSRGTTYLVCDGGMHHHLALSGNLGAVLRRNWPLIAIDRLDDEAIETVDLAGPLCTPLDVLGKNQSLPPLSPGDWVGVLQSGAYGASASPGGFLSRDAANEFLV
ncbi:pyridoxal-dependent decarboxylase, exosortase A system-associated [Guyparkeria hydrothermalis]|uniref:pyridoxal-dependent decarboxylase, exosortase A system-associated n=1 Tax=Guyparkeria hydrothermalis TaxID=923 RepID=UPI00202225B8|nr:pyridoxal-dependent decarboxylase, exosortase A system-associated [Guyparkeria hydrothermalis]MCL7744477.1 pyridoxal-dependent decarboxylase, exosortase A system-associated [Guyparkeria hydrothermalis]